MHMCFSLGQRFRFTCGIEAPGFSLGTVGAAAIVNVVVRFLDIAIVSSNIPHTGIALMFVFCGSELCLSAVDDINPA